MRLDRLRLVNFRQHRDSEIVFGTGLTGIIGPNGAGKTTLLEAVTWALYGQRAARDKKETLRWRRASPRAEVRVELEFGLGPHELKLVRTLAHAELFLDGGARPIAQSLGAVAERVERLLAMRYEEFHNTYFTGQRDLAVMRDVGPTERRRFLNRLLGYERLERAQKRVCEHRAGLSRDMDTLRQGSPDPEALSAERAARAAADAAAAARLEEVEERLLEVRAASDQHLPVFSGLKEFRAGHQQLTADLRELGGEMKAAVDLLRVLGEQHAAAAQAALELERLAPQVAAWERARDEAAAHEELGRDAEARARIETTVAELDRHRVDLRQRLAAAAAAAAATRDLAIRVEALRDERERVEATYEERKDAWEREKTDATVERRKLLEQFEDLRTQRERVVTAGAPGACPTCGRPLGDEYHAVLELLDGQVEGVKQNGQYWRSKLEALKTAPLDLLELDKRRHDLLQEIEAHGQELAVARRAAGEVLELQREDGELAARRAGLMQDAALLRTGYDRVRHDAARAALQELEPRARAAQRLAGQAERAAALAAELEKAERRRADLVDRVADVQRRLDALAFSEERYLAAEAEMQRLEEAWRTAERTAVEARVERQHAAEMRRLAERHERDARARAERLAGLRGEVRLHEALDAAFGELSADLNAEIGPEMSALAGGFLGTLTGGQYDELELDEAFEATVFADGAPQPVLSGGEQDLRDLTLRLAVSQMIAERSGQPFSLLVLDEIFGSLDEMHRESVMNLLRGLGARFPQVILITHIESVRESLDRVLRVRYDEASGASVVTEEGSGPAPGGRDADVAA